LLLTRLLRSQEVSTVLHVALLWDLPNKHDIAAAAAAAAMQAAGLQDDPTHHQQQQEQHSSAASNDPQQQQQREGPVARTAADAVLLLHRMCSLGYKPPAVLRQHLLAFAGPRLHELSLLQVGMVQLPRMKGGAVLFFAQPAVGLDWLTQRDCCKQST
jgi:hypothetical protein